MKIRSDLHIARKIYHVLGLCIIVIIYQHVSREQALTLLTGFTVVFLVGDLLRLRSRRLNKKAIKVFGPVLRREEVNNLSAMSYLFVGTWMVVFLFPQKIVTLSLLLLAFGDPVAGTVGVLYGKDKILGNKSLQGTLAGFAACVLVSIVYFLTTHQMVDRWILASLISGIIGCLAELVPVGRLDDNLVAPLVSSSLLLLLFHIFGALS